MLCLLLILSLLLLFIVVVVVVSEYIPVRIVLIVDVVSIECIPERICFIRTTYRYVMFTYRCCCCCYYYRFNPIRRGEVRFDPMRFRFDSISIRCWFGTNSTRFRISFDSILIQFDSIRFAPPVTYWWNECEWIRNSPGAEERCDSIRCDSDSIRFRLDADLVPILPNFESASIQF
jgi:hypothetical protein